MKHLLTEIRCHPVASATTALCLALCFAFFLAKAWEIKLFWEVTVVFGFCLGGIALLSYHTIDSDEISEPIEAETPSNIIHLRLPEQAEATAA